MNTTVIAILEALIQNHRELEFDSIDEELRYAIELLSLETQGE